VPPGKRRDGAKKMQADLTLDVIVKKLVIFVKINNEHLRRPNVKFLS
jgi:hypothetical protein